MRASCLPTPAARENDHLHAHLQIAVRPVRRVADRTRVPTREAFVFQHIDDRLHDLTEKLPAAEEGHISDDQAEFLWSFLRLNRPRFVAETGFNAGHSAMVILRAMETYGGGILLSFDIGRHDSTRVAAEMVRTSFNGFAFVEGDSKATLANGIVSVLNKDAALTFDLGIVDGGHDYATAKSDLDVMSSLVKPGGFVWLDDFDNGRVVCSGVNQAGLEFAAARGSCVRFRTPDHRGMMIYQKGF